MRLVDRNPLIDDVLSAFSAALGPARAAYGAHAYRVFNFARQLVGSERLDDALAVASAFHDLGIWSDGTFDYLEPSIRRAEAYIAERAPQLPFALVADAIRNHHLLFPVRAGRDAEVVEAFRRADLIDVSGGLYRAGLDRELVRDLVATFPYAGFHGMLVRTAMGWCAKHPTRPLPMLRLTQADAQAEP